MNTRTGEIGKLPESLTNEDIEKLFGGQFGIPNMVGVNDIDITAKQKAEMQVSKFDNKSILGKVFTGSRQVRRRKERERIKKNLKKRVK